MDFEDDAQSEDIPSSGEEDNTDERKHNQLLDALSSLDGKKRNKLSQRTVISSQVSEFNFSSSKDKTSVVRLNELVGSLKESTSHGELKNQLRNINRNKKTVSTPLPRHEKEKIDRATAYETTTADISKWDPIIKRNRKADQIEFPLEKPDFKIVTTDQLVKRFQPRTPLERQVAELLQGSDSVVQNKEQELTPAEQKALQAMDVKEAKERRMELMKYRALLSYKEAKAKRQKKIKSKRYHRILKKEKLKNEKKHLDKLQEEDPEGYLDKLNLLEKDRAQERVSLKHRGGSKFAKRQMIYAKYDDRARQEVQDMLQKSRTLTKKVDVESDSEDEKFLDVGVSIDNTEIDVAAKSDNPWMARPSSGKPNVSYSRPEAITDHDSRDENEQSEYSRPAEVVNKAAGVDSDDGNEDSENEKTDSEDVDNVKETESNGDNDEEVISMKKKQGTEVHDLSTLNTEQFLSDTNSVHTVKSKVSEEIDEIFENKQNEGKLSRNQRRKRNKNKNKTLADEKSESKKSKSAEHQKKSKKDKVDKKFDIDADSDNDDELKSDSGDIVAKNNKAVVNEEEEEVDEEEQMNNESLSRKRTIEEFEEILSDDSNEEITTRKKMKTDGKNKKKRKETQQQEKNKAKEAFVDPKKLFTIENKIRQVGSTPNVIDTENDNDVDADEQQRLTIAQAFADDDVIEEFSREKEDMVEKGKPKDIDLTLPGWGSWGGEGIKVSARKRKRFTVKAPPPLPRKDGHLGHVIVNESRMAAVAKHMVHEIPFPYTSTEQFEKSIRAPLGKTWNPEAVHKDLVKPKVVTSLGKIINPINKSEGPELVRQVFLERGWVEFDEDDQSESDWNLWWRTSRFRLSDYENLFPWQRLNHYPKSTGITKKDCLVRNLKRMKGVHGSAMYNFSPVSFNLPNDYTRYLAEYGKIKAKTDPKNFAWICKPADMSRGRGIFVFKDISDLQYDCNAVVQQYIACPLLIGGYKFDIRLYVAVPSFHPLTVYVFQEGIVRFSTEKYDMSALNNIFAHLTNTSINKHSPSYTTDKERIGPGCKWTLTQLRYYLHQNSLDDRLLWARVTNIIILTLLIQAPQVPKEKNCYELYGFDILIDENLKPWLLEVNFSPAVGTDCQVDVLVKKPMLHDLIDMLNFKDSDADRVGVEKQVNTGRLTNRGRMSANRNKPEPVDRTTTSSRLSQRGGIQRMNSTISATLKSIDPPEVEQTLSFIQQDNPSIQKTSEEKMCYGLPLVYPSDDEKGDSEDHSGRSSAKSDYIEADIYALYSGARFTPAPTITSIGQPTLEKSYGSFERSGTMSSIKKTESVQSLNQRGDKLSLKSFGNSDSAYSSFSDNSDKVTVSSTNSKSKIFSHRRKSYSLQTEVLSETPREADSFQIKSLRPTENSKSLRKVSNRGVTPVNNIVSFRSKSRVNVPQIDRNMTKSRNVSRTPSNFVTRSSSRFGNVSRRSDQEFSQKNHAQGVMSSMSSVSKTPREKETINLGLTGISKKTPTSHKFRQKSKSLMSHHKPKGPPPKVGDFFLVFPFNEGTFKAANSTLDPHVVIKETQKLFKDLKLEVEKASDDRKIGGLLPYGSAADAERLWAPVKPQPEEQ
ncbi:uncharacterized protein LOC123551914 [Mercenaria mercenaria]|uniref:uncharacterized protein LOC123551914 n=1 Tax=Mercenaria mercenaria TaxID=6596 RepID=UPI00234F6701|nr:uncharacterized protein LOC123551914 [Mercenaria mercenaria]